MYRKVSSFSDALYKFFLTFYPNRRSMSADENWHSAVELAVVESAAAVVAVDPRSSSHKKISVYILLSFRNKEQTNKA